MQWLARGLASPSHPQAPGKPGLVFSSALPNLDMANWKLILPDAPNGPGYDQDTLFLPSSLMIVARGSRARGRILRGVFAALGSRIEPKKEKQDRALSVLFQPALPLPTGFLLPPTNTYTLP